MKLYVEASLEDMDKIMVAGLIDLVDTIDNQPKLTHPDDIKYNKKLRKAADTLLKYYGV